MLTAARSIVVTLVALLGVGLLAPAASALKPDRDPAPLARAHAHNDYEHTRPLHDALAAGVHQRRGRRLARRRQAAGRPRPGRPEAQAAPWRRSTSTRSSSGRSPAAAPVYRKWAGTVPAADRRQERCGHDVPTPIHAELRAHRRIMTTFTGDSVHEGAVTAVISGNRDLAADAGPAQALRRVRRPARRPRLRHLAGGDAAGERQLARPVHLVGHGPDARGPSGPSCTTSSTARTQRGYRVRFWATTDLRRRRPARPCGRSCSPPTSTTSTPTTSRRSRSSSASTTPDPVDEPHGVVRREALGVVVEVDDHVGGLAPSGGTCRPNGRGPRRRTRSRTAPRHRAAGRRRGRW